MTAYKLIKQDLIKWILGRKLLPVKAHNRAVFFFFGGYFLPADSNVVTEGGVLQSLNSAP